MNIERPLIAEFYVPTESCFGESTFYAWQDLIASDSIVPKPPAKRRRTSKNHSMPEIKVRSSPSKEGKDGKSSKSTTAFTYRMNGSPKINGLPAVLSLTSLSGIPQKIQGSSFSSFHKGFCANGLSVSGQSILFLFLKSRHIIIGSSVYFSLNFVYIL